MNPEEKIKTDRMNVFRIIRRNIPLHFINAAGLSIVTASLLLSAGYLYRELNYDRHNTESERTARLSIGFQDEPVDGRIWGEIPVMLLKEIPEIEETASVFHIQSCGFDYGGRLVTAPDVFAVDSGFFRIFDVRMLESADGIPGSEQIMVSESFASKLKGESGGDVLMSPVRTDSRKLRTDTFITGIFEDFPGTSHFHPDAIIYSSEGLGDVFAYVYVLVKEGTDLRELAGKISSLWNEAGIYPQGTVPKAILTPLTDIHLHSHNLREMEVNGNATFLWLIGGANTVLAIVVLFNLWLNGCIVFSYNRRFYYIMRLHGAQVSAVLANEARIALVTGTISTAAGLCLAHLAVHYGLIPLKIPPVAAAIICIAFLAAIVTVSLLPALKDTLRTRFSNTGEALEQMRFSYSNVRWMVSVQFFIVITVITVASGIGMQMGLIEKTQSGGADKNTIVLKWQDDQVMENYALLKESLLKHPEIEAVTSAFQIPGDAIRDGAQVTAEGSGYPVKLPLLLVGEDFMEFFGIRMIGGNGFSPMDMDYQTENGLLHDRIAGNSFSDRTEEYIINEKAMRALGFSDPRQALGKTLGISQGTIDYIRKGTIVGVCEDFNYTGVFEGSVPLLIMQRNLFQSCIMIRMAPGCSEDGLEVFNKVWAGVNPQREPDYTLMSDIFSGQYRNEMNARRLTGLFSILCLVLADLGLIIFMAFIIKRRTREIAIRKVQGASVPGIVRMLNLDLIRYIAVAFIVSIPVSWLVLHRWLEHFSYKIHIWWWIFIAAGAIVAVIALGSVSVQSWRAATANPVKGIGTE